jgi:NAD(P)-dependent dehydrogenase (short-subunit alcohol dehydrogenase family)
MHVLTLLLTILCRRKGVMACPLEFTMDGIEQQYGVNHVAAAALTSMLLPSLRAASEGRVIFVSSIAVTMARGMRSPPLIQSKLSAVVRPKSCMSAFISLPHHICMAFHRPTP